MIFLAKQAEEGGPSCPSCSGCTLTVQQRQADARVVPKNKTKIFMKPNLTGDHLYASICTLMKQENPSKTLSTSEVATLAGIHRDTLLRWLRKRLVPEPGRDRHGWRIFTPKEADYCATFAKSSSPKPEPPPVHSEGIEVLERIDWDFSSAKTIYLTHGIHPYPAKFIPQIPNALIQELSSVGETVADIFCGSGTTLVEALTLKRNAVGVDANPLACLISEAKTIRVNKADVSCLEELIYRALNLAKQFGSPSQPTLFGPFKSSAWRPDHAAIKFWFEPFVVEELAEVLSWCRSLRTESSQKIALVAFSSIIVWVSKQDSDTRYVRRIKKISPGDTFRRFGRTLAEALQAAVEFTKIAEPRFKSRVFNANVLGKVGIGEIDLVVCSPPYPNAYSYHLYHMTRMLWLGMNSAKFKREEIGSHRKYSSRSSNGATVDTFRQEIEITFQWLHHHLRVHRYACFVLGDSTIKGKVIDNASLFSEIAQKCGFAEVARISRRMKDTRKAFNPRIGKIKKEQILILQKRQGR